MQSRLLSLWTKVKCCIFQVCSTYQWSHVSVAKYKIQALWFHQVLQKGDEGVIAINAWYDIEYRNSLYPSMGLFRNLIAGVVDKNKQVLEDDEHHDDI